MFRLALSGTGLSRRALACVTAAGLLLLYWIYSQTITPHVKPPGIDTNVSAGDDGERLPAPLTNLQIARRHLPHVPWAGDAKYQLRTANAFVYAEDWKSIDSDNAIRFQPFAMVWMQKGRQPGEAPVTIVSESAYIRFARKFDIAKPSPGRVIGGALDGPVEIRGPDGLKINGRNFAFSEDAMRLWSDAPLRFAYGPHRGRAHGLQCELLGPDGPPQPDRFAVSGIQSIRLRRNVAMNFLFQNSDRNDLTGRTALPEHRRADSSKKPTLVRVRSKGGFEFGVQTHVATFEEDVRVFRPTQPGQFDVLLCDLLTLIFEPAKTGSDRARFRGVRKSPESGDGQNTAETTNAETNAETNEETNAETKSPTQKDRRESEERFQGIDSRLTFQRLRAQPRYPRRHVVLISEENGLTAHMDDLIYDAQSGIAVLRDREAVQVAQESSETQAPKITLVQSEEGTVTSLVCEGAGWIQHVDEETGHIDLAARWSKWLRKFPDPDSELDIIELQQDAVLHQPQERAALRAEFIRIWMDRQQRSRKEDASGTQRPVAEADDGNDDEKRSRMKLRRMLAVDDVEMTSPEMHARTPRLEVWFEHLEETKGEADARQGRSSRRATPKRRGFRFTQLPRRVPKTGLNTRRVAGTPPAAVRGKSTSLPSVDEISSWGQASAERRRSRGTSVSRSSPGPQPRAWASVPDFSTPEVPLPRKSSTPPRKPVLVPADADSNEPPTSLPSQDGPLHIRAELIQARIQQGQNEKETHVREIRTRGDVQVRQEHGDGEQPLRIIGERLHITAEGKDDHILHVFGTPAHVRDRGMHIEGENIHLDRGENRSWVDGKGLLQLPVKRTLQGNQLDKPQLLDIWWKKGMNFDGETAKFRGQVRAFVENSRIRCQELDVLMSRRVSFQQRPSRDRDRSSGNDEDRPEVKTVICRDSVQVESYDYEGNTLTEIRKARVQQFTLQQESGDTTARGPGWIVVWQRGGSSGRFNRPGKAQANRAARSKKEGWTYTRIDFSGTSQGNLKQRHNRFRDRVQIVYGPVKRPPHVIDVDAEQLPEDSGWLRCRELVVTQHEATKGRGAFLTMRAAGNAEVDGRGFHARADAITYNESQDLYILRSLGRRKATIWRQEKVGQKRSRADAQRMEFIPSRNVLILDRTTTLDGLK